MVGQTHKLEHACAPNPNENQSHCEGNPAAALKGIN